MNTNNITLYYGWKPNAEDAERPFIQNTIINKLENINNIGKGIILPKTPISNEKTNNNIYAITKDYNVITLGMNKIINKNNDIIYEGQRVFTTNKYILAQYYKEKIHIKITQIKNRIKQLQNLLSLDDKTWYDTPYLESKIIQYQQKIKEIQKQYKLILQHIKTI